MQLIANGTQGPTTIPTKVTPSGTPGYANSGEPGTFTPSDADPDVWNTMMAEIAAVATSTGATLNPANNAQMIQAIMAGPGKNIQVFSTPGTSTFTVPANVTKAAAMTVSGGTGAPGTSNASSSQVSASPGAPSGVLGWGIYTVTPGGTESVVVGAGGTGGPANSGSSTAGGASSFGAFLTSPSPGGVAAAVTAGVAPGSQQGLASSMVSSGGAFPGGSNPGQPALLTAGPSNIGGGNGGSGPFGGGGVAGYAGASGISTPGGNGTAPGAGGGGACTVSSGSGQVGGSGAAGIVIVLW